MKSLKSITPLSINEPEKYINNTTESALNFKNVRDKFESIIIETKYEDMINSMEEIKKLSLERKKKFDQI